MSSHGVRAGALTCKRYASGITTERCDVALHPLQCDALVLQREISLETIRCSEKSQNTQPVVHRHDNETELRQGLAVVERDSSSASDVAPAVNPDQNREWPRLSVRRVHVQREAIFAD